MRRTKLRMTVQAQLAKTARLGLPLPVSRLVRVFNLNSGLVYRYLRELESQGLVEKAGRGLYRVREGVRLGIPGGFSGSGPYSGLSRLPEVYYYVAEPPSIEWLGPPGKILVVIDKTLEGRVSLPEPYKPVYTGLRGRSWRYDWDLQVSRGTVEQSLADLLSYDPDYPVEQYILLNLDRIDLNEIARRATPQGLRRLSTFLAFFRAATGRLVPARFDYIGLLDRRLLRERLSEYTSLVFVNDVGTVRGV